MIITIFLLLLQVCLPFILGLVLYKQVLCVRRATKNLAELDLLNKILYLLTLYVFLTYITPILCESFYSLYTIYADGTDPSRIITTAGMKPAPVKQTAPTNTKSGHQPVDGGIMTTAIAGEVKLAQQAPTLATKTAVKGGAIVLGASAIMAKYVSGNYSSYAGKSSIFLIAVTSLSRTADSKESSYMDVLTEYSKVLLNLNGDSVLDLLKLIDILNNLQYLFLYVIAYISILLSFKPSNIESFLIKIFPLSLVNYYMKSINMFNKYSRVYIIILILMLGYNIYLSNYCFNVLYNNFDTICELHLSKK